MSVRRVIVWVIVTLASLAALGAGFVDRSYGWYRIGEVYDARPVSFASPCGRESYSAENRFIYDRSAAGSGRVCIHRKGALRDVIPAGAVIVRSRIDGAYRVVLLLDEPEARRVRALERESAGMLIVYRRDTVLTRFSGFGRTGRGAEIASYHERREEADIAMSQVAIPGGEWPTHSWLR